jgi:hypothetical protein
LASIDTDFWPPRKGQVPLTIHGLTFACDESIVDLMSFLNREGYETKGSCEGGPYPHLPKPYVVVGGKTSIPFTSRVAAQMARRKVISNLPHETELKWTKELPHSTVELSFGRHILRGLDGEYPYSSSSFVIRPKDGVTTAAARKEGFAWLRYSCSKNDRPSPI